MARPPFEFLTTGRIAARLPIGGIGLLRDVLDELAAVVATPEAPGAERLFPRAYADAQAEAAFQSRARERVIEARQVRLETMRRTLDRGAAHRGTWQVELEPDELHAWIGVCNDARVMLGTVLDVTEDDQPRRYLRAGEPDAATVNAYLWLGALLETALGVINPD